MIVTFCGHGQMTDPSGAIRIWLEESVRKMIDSGATQFYLGGYGSFDQLAASVVWELKKQYPHICSTLVLPYPDRKVFTDCYDDTLYPPLETVPKRFAISHRNRWMVDHSDIVITYVTHDWGGAAQMLQYAERRKKHILQY